MVHCSALTDFFFPFVQRDGSTMQNGRVAYADVRDLWPVSMATQLLPKLSQDRRKILKIETCVSLPVAAPPFADDAVITQNGLCAIITSINVS